MKLLLAGVMVGAFAPIIASAPARAQTTETLNENQNFPIVRNAPGLSLSSIYGLNPCSLGASAGVTTPLFGVAGAISTTDKGCEVRNTAALVVSALKDEGAAREILCDLPEFRQAVLRLGHPCLIDQPKTAATTPAPVAAATVSATPASASSPHSTATKAVTKLAPNAPVYCNQQYLVLSAYPECTSISADAVNAVIQPPPHQPVAPTTTTPRRLEEPVAAPAKPSPQTRKPLDKDTPAAVNEPSSKPQVHKPADEDTHPAAANEPLPDVLIERGKAMLTAGDISAARRCFQASADMGNPQAAEELGKTYDPMFLAKINVIGGVQGDSTIATLWYHKALAMAETKAKTAIASR